MRFPGLIGLSLLLSAAPAKALDIELQIGSMQLPGVEQAITDIALQGRLQAGAGQVAMRDARLQWRHSDGIIGKAQASVEVDGRTRKLVLQSDALQLAPLIAMLRDRVAAAEQHDLLASGVAALELRAQQRGAQWQADVQLRLQDLAASIQGGRHAGEQLTLQIVLKAQGSAQAVSLQSDLRLTAGQAYVEPVFVDFSQAPATLAFQLESTGQPDPSAPSTWQVSALHARQSGVGEAHGAAELRLPGPQLHNARLRWNALQLGPAFATYAQPFLVGGVLEQAQPGGRSSGELIWRDGGVEQLQASLQDAALQLPAQALQLHGLDGEVNWHRTAPTASGPQPHARPDSQLDWRGGKIGGLELGASALRFRTHARAFELLAPLRVPMAGGALRFDRLRFQQLGQPGMDAQLQAEIEPLELAALCRGFGWPEFSGTLAGRIPGVRLHDGELEVDGGLTAQAFDGQMSVQSLRVLDPFGRLPRVAADIHLRNLDLGQLTSAFSFGRIEGRLEGDVEDLRLLDWKPVAFRAHLGTPEGDRSRKRISQRAIDTLSSIGGGPTGMLSRGALGLFDDFAYARIGWSCTLSNGVCVMDGIEPADNGGYVLVKGRWLPRIDVVGYNRRVDWNTFVQQLVSATRSGPVQVR